LGDLSRGIGVTLTRSSLTGSMVKSCSVPGTKNFKLWVQKLTCLLVDAAPVLTSVFELLGRIVYT
jgi:hypothetical protein